MRILVIADVIPMHDRSAGSFRFFHILRILASNHEVKLHPFQLEWQHGYYGREEVCPYLRDLERLGIAITNGEWADLSKSLRGTVIDIVFFEHYTAAKKNYLNYVRFWQPKARVMVDTIDVAYNRLFSKAKLTKRPEDRKLADTVKAEELSIYSRSDMVIGISNFDRALLVKDRRGLRVEVVPLIYTVPPLREPKRRRTCNLIFVAHFDHEANVDGIRYFCTDVLPRIQKELPDIHLRIVGHSPPDAVTKLAGPSVEVLGFVPDISAIYAASDVAIAPMRYGGGLKGKIAEAMSHGLPVVTNSVCLEGFALTPRQEVMVGDDPIAFANAVVEVLRDANLHQTLRERGWHHIKTHYSEEVVAEMLNDVIDRCQYYPAKKLPPLKRISWMAKTFLEQYVLWRFRRGAIQDSR